MLCYTFSLIVLILHLVVAKTQQETSSPVIGVLSQPYHTADGEVEFWIPASYVKWLETGGCRAIPIPYYSTFQEVQDIVSQVNGVLFPGGANNALAPAAQHVWDLAMEEEFFPIWGTCLGFEYLITLVSQQIQDGFEAENISLPLSLWPSSSSELYKTQEMKTLVKKHNIAMNNHKRGIEPSNFLRDDHLTSMFHISSVNVDLNGRSFVSTIEPNNPDQHPYYGVQYHPEKNAFEYNTVDNVPYEAINHSPEAIQVSLYLAIFFGKLARKNRHVYNGKYPLVQSYPVKKTIGFEQVYAIPNCTICGRDEISI